MFQRRTDEPEWTSGSVSCSIIGAPACKCRALAFRLSCVLATGAALIGLFISLGVSAAALTDGTGRYSSAFARDTNQLPFSLTFLLRGKSIYVSVIVLSAQSGGAALTSQTCSLRAAAQSLHSQINTSKSGAEQRGSEASVVLVLQTGSCCVVGLTIRHDRGADRVRGQGSGVKVRGQGQAERWTRPLTH